jgi:hypothetical protein
VLIEAWYYQTDLRAQGRIMIAVKGKHMAEPCPAWTAIDVDRLRPDNGFAEIRLTLHAPKR